jgi:uncharacterized damage-inducible protein DinB
MPAAEVLCRGIAREFRRRTCEEQVPRIRRCVDLLTEAQCWHRPAPVSNSVGNLLLHLCGNVTQWILCGVRGDPDQRDRPAEFAASAGDAGATARELAQRLAAILGEAAAAVEGLTPEQWLETRTFQGRYRETVLAAVLHVMEHCSGHAGQIYAFTKQTTGIDLKFYDLR